MQELPTSRAPLALGLCALAAVSVSSCDHHHHDDHFGSVPSFFEVEPNDDALTANDFGFLAPGDHFFIEGAISDSGFDPFDGFWFTSTGPIHVDFQLFIDDPFADLDVCLYDPVIDATIDCYQTSDNPEQGGVDVTGGNIDFHLIVESFVGSSTYGLEIVVLPLAPEPSPAAAAASPVAGLRAVKPADTVEKAIGTDAFRAYATPPGKVVLRSRFDVDPELGIVIESTTIERTPAERVLKSVKVR